LRAAETFFEPSHTGESASDSPDDAGRVTKRSDPGSAHDLEDVIGRLAGVAERPLSEMVKRVHLSDQQHAAIHRIFTGTISEMRRLRLEAASKGPERNQLAQRRDKLLDECRCRALDVLTPQQRAQWGKLLDERQTDPLRTSVFQFVAAPAPPLISPAPATTAAPGKLSEAETRKKAHSPP
jgi:Spy/CpxP family protein refolding chaperone